MSLYRKMDAPQAAGPGVSGDGADAANKVIENLLSVGGFNETAQDHQQAVKAFSDALNGTASPPPPELPPLEVTNTQSSPMAGLESSHSFGPELSSHMDGLMGTVMDIAGKLADPIGFINAICQFLIALFMDAGAQLAQALPQFDLYNQAAQAALDSKKMLNLDVDPAP